MEKGVLLKKLFGRQALRTVLLKKRRGRGLRAPYSLKNGVAGASGVLPKIFLRLYFLFELLECRTSYLIPYFLLGVLLI